MIQVSARNNILWPFEQEKMKSLRYAIILFLYLKLIAECRTADFCSIVWYSMLYAFGLIEVRNSA